jgi:hypothetical protein
MDSSILDVAIGLSLIFATFALVASGITDGIAAILNLRGRMLYTALVRTLNDSGTKVLLKHVAVQPLQRKTARNLEGAKKGNSPSYIPSWLFAAAATDIDLRAQIQSSDGETSAPTAEQAATELVDRLADTPLADVVSSVTRTGATTIDEVRGGLERWFDGYMERVSGWYKRRTQWILLVVGVLVALGGNVDAISLTRQLAEDSSLTAQVLELTDTGACESGDNDCITNTLDALPGAQLGLFWTSTCTDCGGFWERRNLDDGGDWLKKIGGILMGGIALSFGAPFWYDLIGRGKALKSAGKQPSEATETG